MGAIDAATPECKWADARHLGMVRNGIPDGYLKCCSRLLIGQFSPLHQLVGGHRPQRLCRVDPLRTA